MGSVVKLDDLAKTPPAPKPKSGLTTWLSKYITCDPYSLDLIAACTYASRVHLSAIIYGETGTGKEIIARILHGDRSGEFISINCGGIPENLLESELFGHVRGAFTGANGDKQGLFSAANDGTIFLDEIAELPLFMQVKLLRVLQEKVVRRVGSTREEELKCRVVAATHENLQDKIKQKLFRQDLYYRLAALEFTTKPLRERLCDIPLLAEFYGWPKETPIPEHDWPGNIRQFQKAAARAKFNSLLAENGCSHKQALIV